MTEVRPAESAEPGLWVVGADVGWWDLVRYGPPGFEVYVRVAFAKDPGPGEDPTLRRALEVLAGHTATPSRAFAAVWEGWWAPPPEAPEAPRLEIPNRTMLLFTGPVDVLRDAPALGWLGSAQGHVQEPHLVWPEDRAWCLACEVDEEVEFTVGCSEAAARVLADALPDVVRRVRYGESAPLYRDGA